ncbi:hypothetical protein COX85_02910 [Candidatus Micrarchaeota archaeon CG_4_10_14_0_2_um_filter_55_9]|nr:MAG: hypothetical protein AUJ15_02840 [Candidatus Micrarchaeota archaeon CG1_02_55_41]PIO03199.1 MAG: hypothetical protein COT57_00905 [Candidatus Micrarchaeota archaeon CG09_land_8_20_14_0_10_55_25]PIZ91613.1 MAG: hypothetical protein COX85_02910 [Candidatus Micrarchaeota archaeon CG_4_10_14_0_2_um_filter_55_9]PJD01152.1 MAG: hypothetical protein COU38_02515 [Candidatus Micrarchaeota archaeon CG10_big_fil_rev_8_21_14_0_10_54_18]
MIAAIPAKRLPVLRRDGERFLDELEDRCGVEVDFGGGEVRVEGEAGDEWLAGQVLHAVALGFTPRQAFKLLKEDCFLEVLDLKALARNEKDLQRFKSRLIGSQGKAKKTLQELSGAWLSVGSHEVALLGGYESIQLAKEGIQKLLEGKTHSTVYAYLERRIKG